MAFWIAVSVVGVVVALSGLAVLHRRYRRREITRRHLLAVTVGLVSFLAYAFLSAFRPELVSGLPGVIVLLPAFIAIVIVVRDRQRAGPPDGPR